MAPHPRAPRGRWRRSPAFAGMGTDGIFLPHRGSRGYCLAGGCWPARDIASWRVCGIAGASVTAGALFTGVASSVLVADLVYRDTWDLPGGAVEGEEPAMLRAAARWLRSPGWIAARAGCHRWAGRRRDRDARESWPWRTPVACYAPIMLMRSQCQTVDPPESRPWARVRWPGGGLSPDARFCMSGRGLLPTPGIAYIPPLVCTTSNQITSDMGRLVIRRTCLHLLINQPTGSLLG